MEISSPDEHDPVDPHQDLVNTSTTIEHENNAFHKIANWSKTKPFFIVICNLVKFFCLKSPNRAYFGTVIFLIITMTTGILTICLTSPESKNNCGIIDIRIITNITNYDSHPQSIAIGYFNNDTQLDFVIANTGFDTIDIYLGYQNQTFQHHTTYSTGDNSNPCSVAIGNFDNKSGIDIAVANFGTNSIGIFLGYNNGTFIFHESFSTESSHPLFIAIADLNNDYQLDIAVVNYGTDSISIFIGFGDGSFAFLMSYSTGYDSFPKSIAIADLNNDNKLDIVVANYGTNNIVIFFGQENGRFEDEKIYSTGFQSNPSSVIIRDINNDNYLDIIIANYGTNNIGIFLGYQNGSFAKQATYSTGSNSHPEFINVGDFNKDNKLDIIAIDSVNDKVYILPGNENGTFPSLTIYPTGMGSGPVSVGIVNFNNDNESTAVLVKRDENNIVTLIDYNIIFSSTYDLLTVDTLISPISIATGDLNGDNSLDIITINKKNTLINIFLGYGNGSFTFHTVFATNGNSSGNLIVLGDFNNDDHLDIAIVIPDESNLGIFLGYGNGMFSTIIKYPTKNVLSPQSLSLGDLNNDNCLDIIIISETSDLIGIFIGYCNGTFLLLSTYKAESGWGTSYIVMDDFNSDNHLDVAIAYSKNSAISIFYGDGNGRLLINRTHAVSDVFTFTSIASGDFNNDNQRDIVVTVLENSGIMIFFLDVNGMSFTIRTFPLEFCLLPISLVVADFNSDTETDIAVACQNSSNVVILNGNSDASFSIQTTYRTELNSVPSSLISGDFNNDNLLDIAVANYGTDSVGIFIDYYGAHFSMETKYFTGSGPHPYSIATADFNNDNLLDIVIVNSGNDNISIRLGFGNGSFGIETTYSTGESSFPQYVNIADFNKDDYVDIVVANYNRGSIIIYFGYGNGSFGNSLTYTIDPQSHPSSIGISDFNNDQWCDLIVTNEGTGEVGVFYGYNYASFELQHTYSTGINSFSATVSVGDINNDNQLDMVTVNQAQSNVGVYFGYGNGSFMNQITFSTGNESEPFDIALNDMNNDSYLDIIVVNIGTKSIGILLNYGNGTFRPIISFTTGTRSSITAIVVDDVNNDNRLDVIVTDDISNSVGVFLGFGNGSFSPMTTYSTDTKSEPSSIALGDLNNDNYLDIVVANFGTDSVSVLQGFGNGSFALIMTYLLEKQSDPTSVALADFNNDNKLDIAVIDTNTIVIFLGFGNGNFSIKKTYSTGFGCEPNYIIVGEFNGDDRVDIAVSCMVQTAVTFLFGTKDGGFLLGRKYPSSINSNYISMAFGDFNNDSRLDFVIVSSFNDNIDIYRGNGNEPFGTPQSESTGLNSKPHSVAISDFNNDNRSDIVVANYGTNNIGIILANEDEDFSDLITYSTGSGSRPHAVVTGDFNDDNYLDIVVVNSGTNDIIIFQGYGNGSFIKTRSYSAGTESTPYAIAVSDFNNDKQLDLAIVNAGTNNVFILFGFGNGSFGNKTSYSIGYNSRPYSIVVGDFNNDTSMDMAIANYGTDTVAILLKPC